jgi:bifunctional N-acetylglucosamine-1-phosphate-uridyltransferase/glucosamine-1-phosphate-acetyltransferase GlmU-like protein
MTPVLTQADLPRIAALEYNPAHWTVIVPAAGKGSRLGYPLPKILYPVAGKPILEWLLERFSNLCGQFVFVLSPEGEKHVQPHLERLLAGNFEIAVQEAPSGMGDAVLKGLRAVHTPCCAAVWGDQVSLKRSTIVTGLKTIENHPQCLFAFPTILRPDPYIHFVRDSKDIITKVLQAREGDRMPAAGESDCGLFFFRTKEICRALEKYKESGELVGTATKESNFLPLIPLLDDTPGSVISLRIIETRETIGINTKEEAAVLEKYLLKLR